MVAYSYKPSIWEAETRESRVRVQPVIHTEFRASLGYRGKPCLKKRTCLLCVRRGSPPHGCEQPSPSQFCLLMPAVLERSTS